MFRLHIKHRKKIFSLKSNVKLPDSIFYFTFSWISRWWKHTEMGVTKYTYSSGKREKNFHWPWLDLVLIAFSYFLLSFLFAVALECFHGQWGGDLVAGGGIFFKLKINFGLLGEKRLLFGKKKKTFSRNFSKILLNVCWATFWGKISPQNQIFSFDPLLAKLNFFSLNMVFPKVVQSHRKRSFEACRAESPPSANLFSQTRLKSFFRDCEELYQKKNFNRVFAWVPPLVKKSWFFKSYSKYAKNNFETLFGK